MNNYLVLDRLTLKNFKGIKQFELITDGKSCNVFGDNATGKTTLFDALTWLLFDKDSQNQKEFAIKTLDATGNAIHYLEHEVEAVFDISGHELTLRKVYAEQWTKKRGSAIKEFTGHTTDYFIDGVPVKRNEYTAKINEIVDENIFKLLTNPAYFNESLKWNERRKILLDVCGDISDADVIAGDKALARLPEILGNRKLEDHRKVIAARRAEVNKELDKIPVRIDEVMRSLPVCEGQYVDEAQQKIVQLTADLQAKQQELARIESGGEVAEKKRQLAEANAELMQLISKHNAEVDADVREKRTDLMATENDANRITRDITALRDKIDANKKLIITKTTAMDGLRKRWDEEDTKAFTGDDTCPTCGQMLPPEQIEEAKATFNRKKAETLEQISADGKRLSAEANQLQQENTELQKQIAVLEAHYKETQKEINFIQSLISISTAPAESAEAKDLRLKIDGLNSAINALQEGSREAMASVQQEIDQIREQIATHERTLSMVEQRKVGEARVEELKQQERELAAEFEKLEGELYLTEQFVKTKVAMLEERINSRFKLARFKLFDTQINGGVAECCETLYNGVPYSGGLNNAARINIGLDIINTLAERYSLNAMIFVDNREAVTKLTETQAQIISLIVSEPDKTLRVEAA